MPFTLYDAEHVSMPKLSFQQVKSGPFETQALLVRPDPKLDKNSLAIFTHGYTAYKNALLTWPERLAVEGVTTVLFDLPGHYLGTSCEVDSIEQFFTHTPKLFSSCVELAELQRQSNFEHLFVGGHSLGAIMSLYALDSLAEKYLALHAFLVGFGVEKEGEKHLLESPFFGKTLEFRNQLVSPAITSNHLFSWLKKSKEKLAVKNHNVTMITGLDDIVAGKGGSERMKEILLKNHNQVTLITPKNLPHHRPELASIYLAREIRSLLKRN